MDRPKIFLCCLCLCKRERKKERGVSATTKCSSLNFYFVLLLEPETYFNITSPLCCHNQGPAAVMGGRFKNENDIEEVGRSQPKKKANVKVGAARSGRQQ